MVLLTVNGAVVRRRVPLAAMAAGGVAGLLLYAMLPAFEGYVTWVVAVVDGLGALSPANPGLLVSLGVAALIGLSMNFLPCNLPVVMSLLPATSGEASRTAFVRKTGLYGLGAVLSLGTLGFVLGLLGESLVPLARAYPSVGPYVAGAVIGGVGLLSALWGLREFGVVTLPAVPVPVSVTGPLRQAVDGRDGPGEYVLLGAVYGGTGGGCPLPTYHLLLVWVVVAASPVYGAAVMGTYVLGRVLPVAVVGAVLREHPRRAADLFGRKYGTLRRVNGTVLVGGGCLLVVFTAARALAGVG